jgi:flagellar motor switch protein FliG
MDVTLTNAMIRRIARHLVQFPKPETTKIFSSIPSEDRVRIMEEIKRIKDDSPKID